MDIFYEYYLLCIHTSPGSFALFRIRSASYGGQPPHPPLHKDEINVQIETRMDTTARKTLYLIAVRVQKFQ